MKVSAYLVNPPGKGPFAAVVFLHKSQASSPILFRFSSADRFVAVEDATQLYEAAKEPKNIQLYKGDHEASFSMGQHDCLEWLRGQLQLAPLEITN